MNEDELAAAIRRGERRALARAITLVESTRPDHRRRADRLLGTLLADTGDSVRIGITGVPGVGKSTFIEAFGGLVVERGQRIAVLSVDPSSAVSGGSILGDKTRMEALARHPRAYIRPTAAAGGLGGVARRTRESILILEAARFDFVVVETVGVGQSETMVAEMTDLFLLLLMPGAGDELQGIKRGIMELADIVLVNKADGELAASAGVTAAEYANALRLMQRRYREWSVPVLRCSARDGTGIDEVLERVEAFIEMSRRHGYRERSRDRQQVHWFRQELKEGLLARIAADEGLARAIRRAEQDVLARRVTAAGAAARVIDLIMNSRSTSE